MADLSYSVAKAIPINFSYENDSKKTPLRNVIVIAKGTVPDKQEPTEGTTVVAIQTWGQV